MPIKPIEERFGEIVAEVERIVEGPSIFDWCLPVNNETLAILRSIQMKLGRLQEDNADKQRTIQYLQERRRVMECQGIECCCRCAHKLKIVDTGITYICKATNPGKLTGEHGTCDLWEHIPSSQDPVGKNERLISAIQGAEKGILTLQYTLEEWHDEEGTKALQGFSIEAQIGVCTVRLHFK